MIGSDILENQFADLFRAKSLTRSIDFHLQVENFSLQLKVVSSVPLA